MYAIYLSSWPAFGRSEEDREAAHRRAIYEARMATDFRGGVAAPTIGLVARLRCAIGGRFGQVDSCASPA